MNGAQPFNAEVAENCKRTQRTAEDREGLSRLEGLADAVVTLRWYRPGRAHQRYRRNDCGLGNHGSFHRYALLSSVRLQFSFAVLCALCSSLQFSALKLFDRPERSSALLRMKGIAKKRSRRERRLPFFLQMRELATGGLLRNLANRLLGGGLTDRFLRTSLLRAALTGTLLCSHCELSIHGGTCSRPIPRWIRRDDDRYAWLSPCCAWIVATHASAEAREVLDTAPSYGVTQAGETEVSDFDRRNHDRLAGIAALARTHALGDAHRLQVVQHEDR